MNGAAELVIAIEHQDLNDLAARSAGIWIGQSLNGAGQAAFRHDRLDLEALRLAGLQPFEFAAICRSQG